jgi:WD40 repeat protein
LSDQGGASVRDYATEHSGKRVFLSYSRTDSAFTARLADSLAARGYEPDYDQSQSDPVNSGISPQDEWWLRIQQMIIATDTMVFIVSPDSAKSKVCDDEIAYARGVSKRIVPILLRPIDFAKAPARLSALNIKISFVANSDLAFRASLDQLCLALDTDIVWYRESRRLTSLAARWVADGRPDDLLLTAADERSVGNLLERRPREAPAPWEVLVEFRDRSRAKLEDDDRKRRRMIGRAFVKPSLQAMEDGANESALRKAAAGALLADDLSLKLVPELRSPIARALFDNKTRAVLNGHAGAVVAASFSPDGRRIVTASDDKTARVWDAESGKEIVVLKAHEGAVSSASFSPDGCRIVTASKDRTARVWDAGGGTAIAVLKAHEIVSDAHEDVTSASFSPDGRRIGTTERRSARVWDAENGNEIAVFDPNQIVSGASFSELGFRTVTAASLNTSRVRDVELQENISVLRTRWEMDGFVTAFSPDGRRVVIASVSNKARVWDVESGKRIARLNVARPMLWALFSPDGRRIVTASYRPNSYAVLVWDAESGKEIAVLKAHEGAVNSAAFSPDGSRIVTASHDTTARIWDAENGKEIAALKAHEGAVNSAAFSPDGRRIVTSSSDCTARVWDAACRTEIALLKGHKEPLTTAAFSPDGCRIVTGFGDTTARVWDAEGGTEIAILKGHKGWNFPKRTWIVTAFSPNGRRIVTASDGTARVWDAESGKEIATLSGQEAKVGSAVFSPDSRRLVTIANELRIATTADEIRAATPADEMMLTRVWDAENGKEIAVLKGVMKTASFSPDSSRIVTASGDKTARVWDGESGREIAVLKAHEGGVNSASFSPDGRRIVTASDDKTARVWDGESGREIAVLKAHEGAVSSASFSPDGCRIVTASEDRTARVWDAESETEIAALKAHDHSYGRCTLSTAFSADGRRIMTASDGDTARVWDVSRTEAIVSEQALVVTAALARGIGRRSESERNDMLMQDTKDDLHPWALMQLNGAPQAPEIGEIEVALAAPLHPNCYLSPTQFAEKFTASACYDRSYWLVVLGLAILLFAGGLIGAIAHFW